MAELLKAVMKKLMLYIVLLSVHINLIAGDISFKVKSLTADSINLKISDMDFMYSVILIGIVLLIFFLLRELWTWYWKINKLVSNQEETKRYLKAILAELRKLPREEEDEKVIKNTQTNVTLKNILTGNVKVYPVEEYKSWDKSKKMEWKIID